MDVISSVSNPKIKQVVKLNASAGAREKAGLFVLEGLRLCLDLLRSGLQAEELYFTEKAADRNGTEIAALQAHSAAAYLVTEAVAAKLSDTSHSQGVYCVVRMPEQKEEPLSKTGKYLLLENVQDPANLGAISRTAEALGLTGLLVSGGCDRYSPKALRASMGALLRLPVYQTTEVTKTILNAASLGLKTYASTPRTDAIPVTAADFSGGVLCVVGNEANGITEETLQCCQHPVTIPMAGRAESLNAGAAASILMWEMVKPYETTELLDLAP